MEEYLNEVAGLTFNTFSINENHDTITMIVDDNENTYTLSIYQEEIHNGNCST